MKLFGLWVFYAAFTFAAEPIQLFNGKNLDGWTVDVPEADKNPTISPSFAVRNGLLVSLGKPLGHLITQQSFSNYKLTVEYRFPEKSGNGGVLIHASKPRALYGMFPQSIEVQMMHENAGDFWCIAENIEVPDMDKRRPAKLGQKPGGGQDDARNIKKLITGAEKPLGEWNAMIIECKGAELIVHLNGQLVNHGYKCTATGGKIAIQAEGTVLEFRKIELLPIKP